MFEDTAAPTFVVFSATSPPAAHDASVAHVVHSLCALKGRRGGLETTAKAVTKSIRRLKSLNGRMRRFLLLSVVAAEVVNLTDVTFEHDTQISTGATTGDWFVAFCMDACPWTALEALDEVLTSRDDNSVNVATVDAEEHLALAERFRVINATRIHLFSRGKMWEFEGAHTSAAMDKFLNDTDKGEGAKIPRKAGPLKGLKESLDDFFERVDYRAICLGLVAVAVVLILIGAFTPHAETDDDTSADTKSATPTKKKNS